MLPNDTTQRKVNCFIFKTCELVFFLWQATCHILLQSQPDLFQKKQKQIQESF